MRRTLSDPHRCRRACAMLGLGGKRRRQDAAEDLHARSSKNVIGKTVTGTLTSSNVDPLAGSVRHLRPGQEGDERRSPSCGSRSRDVDQAFYCVPTVLSTEPDVVNYKCTFKGADTATFIKLIFKVKYDQD